MRLCLIGLFLAGRAFALSIEGPAVAVCGDQNVYRVIGASPEGPYTWRLGWKGAKGERETWEGDDNEPALNLTFTGDPGPHSLQLVAADGAVSNSEEIEALAAGGPGFRSEVPSVVSAPLPAVPVLSAAELNGILGSGAPPRERVPPVPLQTESAQTKPNDPVVVSPNSAGILDLTSAPVPQDPDPLTNPFRVRYRPRMQVREVPLQIGLILVGDRPEAASAILNGKLYSVGDVFEGMPIAAITPGTIELRQDQLLLRIPADDRPITLRLLR